MKKTLLSLISCFLFLVPLTWSQNVGIGTTIPAARLHVTDSNVVFSATGIVPVVQGNPPISGSGRRMMWYADKAAFRSGYADEGSWDKSITGDYSFASGYDTKAAGRSSVAMGWHTTADANYSFAAGQFSFALGEALLPLDIILLPVGIIPSLPDFLLMQVEAVQQPWAVLLLRAE